MNNIAYTIADIYKIKVTSNCKLDKERLFKNIDDFRRLTINFEVTDKFSKPNFEIHLEDSNLQKIVVGKKKITFFFKINEIYDSTLLPLLYRYAVEILRQQSAEYKIHSSSVTKDGKSIVLVADHGGGKSTIAYNLCKMGYELISNDASVTKKIGDDIIILRGDTSIRIEENKSIKSTDKMDLKLAEKTWYDKKIIDKNSIKVSTKYNKLNYIIFVKIDDFNEFKFRKYDKCNAVQWFRQKYILYQNLSGTLRGVDLMPLDSNGMILPLVVPKFDSNEMAINRQNYINNLFEICEVYIIEGSLDKILKKINSIVEGVEE